ncbi:MAG: nucleoprotein/polynucleotide-associated enzyme [Cellvibrionaceae bacterium]|nr:nucleoprotein/polynucleotide-associated enzyme [Cellvibrionaceae bacterium]
MSSLQEQMLKAGLVDAKKAKQNQKDKRKAAKVQKKSKQEVVDETKLQAQKVREEKAAKDRELNAQRQAEVERKAIAAQIKQLIEMNVQSKGGGDIAYNFTDGKQIKKLYVTAELQRLLTRGRLAIVKLGESYELVPTPVAEKIAERDSSAIVSLAEVSTEAAEEDDPYADYQIPDDLMW